MTAPVPVPDGTTPPAEAVEAAIAELRAQGDPIHSWRCAYPERYGPCDCIESAGHDIAAAVVAALDLPKRDREASAKALEEAAQRWTWGKWSDVMLPAPKPGAIPALDYGQRAGDWLRSCAAALREGRES